MDTSMNAKAEAWKMEESPSKFNVPLGGDPNFSGPVTIRKCTDCCWIFVFLLANLALGAFSTYSFWRGDPHRLIHGWDFRGELCGEGGLASKPYTFLINPTNSTTISVCLEGCPILESDSAVCLYAPDHVSDTPDFPCFAAYPSKPYKNRYCLPAAREPRDKVLSWLFEPMQVVTWTLGDYYRAWDVLAVAGIVSALATLLYMTWLKTGFCVILLGICSVVGLWLLLAGIVYLLYEEADKVADDIFDSFDIVYMQETNRSDWSFPYRVLCYSTGVLCAFLIVATLFSTGKLCKGPKFLSLTMRTLRQATCLALLPIVIFLLGAGIFALLITLATYAGSCGTISIVSSDLLGEDVKEISFGIVERCLIFYAILVVLWWFSLLATVVEYISSSYTAFWFFGKDKMALDRPFIRSVSNLFSYHLGSVVLSSVAVPALRTPKYIFGALKAFSTFLGVDKSRFCSSCFGLCFDLYESVLRYLNYHAIAYQSLWGVSFCEAARRGFFLIKRSEGSCGRVLAAGDYYVWVLQLVVTMTAPVFVFFWVIHMDLTFQGETNKHIATATGMACLALLISWFSAQVLGGFMRGVMYGGVVCYLSDAEMFVGEQRFADNQLAFLFGEKESSAKALRPIKENKTKDRDSMQEFLYETPVKAERPIPFLVPEKPTQVIKTDVPPPARIVETGRGGVRTQAFEVPVRPPQIPDILRQTMSSASSGLTSSLSEAQFFIPPNVVPPPASRKESRESRDKVKSSTTRKQEGQDSVRNLKGPTSNRGNSRRKPQTEEPDDDSASGSDSLSSYSDSEGEEVGNRRPIARPSSRGDAHPRRGAAKGGKRA